MAKYAIGFSPDVEILLPQFDVDGANAFAGETFRVEFARDDDASDLCSESGSVEYTVADDGSVSLSSERLYLVSRSLVDNTQTPQEGDYTEGAACVYSVGDPHVEDSDNLVLVNDSFANINYQSEATKMTYYSVFVPDISFILPYSGELGDDHVFFGAKFEVIFVMENSSNEKCGEYDSEERVFLQSYKVRSNGNVTAKGEAIRLVDSFVLPEEGGESEGDSEPAETTETSNRCSYSIEFPSSVSSRTSGFNMLARSTVTANIIGGDSRVEASYEAMFIPDVTITVPQIDENGDGDNDFSGSRFWVSFISGQPSDSGCSPTIRFTYRIKDNGTVKLTEEAEELVDRINSTAPECTYRVSVIVFPSDRLVYSSQGNGNNVAVEGESPSVSLTFVEASTE